MAGSNITVEQVQQIARLARLQIDPQQARRLGQELGAILDYVATIGQLDTTGVEPMAHPLPLQNVLREDVAGEALPVEQVLMNAPQTDGPFFKVPKVIGGEKPEA